MAVFRLSFTLLLQANTDCKSCPHKSLGTACYTSCPPETYETTGNRCQACNVACRSQPGLPLSCTGSGSNLGPGGCKECELGVFNSLGQLVSYLLYELSLLAESADHALRGVCMMRTRCDLARGCLRRYTLTTYPLDSKDGTSQFHVFQTTRTVVVAVSYCVDKRNLAVAVRAEFIVLPVFLSVLL